MEYNRLEYKSITGKKRCFFCNKILKRNTFWYFVNDKVYCCTEGRDKEIEKLNIYFRHEDMKKKK